MPRVTDTRQRVREIADALQSEGLEPTPGLVRERLGKGSPNTIVEELRAWRAATASAAAARDAALSAPSPAPFAAAAPAQLERLAGLLEDSLRATREHAEQLEALVQLPEQIRTLTQGLTTLELELQRQAQAAASQNQRFEQQLQLVQDRADAVQKHMLLSIEEAREDARRWKEAARKAQDETQTWRFTLQRRVEELLAENGRLKGAFETAAGSPRPRGLPPAPRPQEPEYPRGESEVPPDGPAFDPFALEAKRIRDARELEEAEAESLKQLSSRRAPFPSGERAEAFDDYRE